MSSLTAATTSQTYAQRWPSRDSPETRMSDTISSALSAGTLSSTDATALTGALTSIDASLSADRSSGTSQATLDPASMKDRIDGLIADQVSSGSLTSDQATELKNLFASHGRSTQAAEDGSGVPDADGPPGPPPSDAAPAGAAESGASTNDLLATFIQQLQSGQSTGAGYGASGTSTGAGSAALLFDFRS
jgi:hypothetical protein